MRVKNILIASAVMLLSGCVKLRLIPYMEQALILEEFGNDKEGQHQYVINSDLKFDQMRKAIETGSIKQYKNQQDILNAFGRPILERDVVKNEQHYHQAIYRYVIQFKGPHKVYIYYDQSGQIATIESI